MTGIVDNPSLATGASLNYRASSATFNNSWNWNLHYRVAASYITGSHNFKVGFNNAYLHHENTTYTNPATEYYFNFANGNPSQVVYRIPRTVAVDVDYDMGLFAQDRWTVGRWTLAGGVRFDAYKNHFPESSISPTFLAPNLNVSFPKIDNISWKDVTPKLGATYDLFGNGKTALKVTLNKYLEGMGTTGFGAAQVTDAPNPLNRLSGTLAPFPTRTWADTNGNFAPDCNLQNYQANGECLALTGAAIFGTVVPGTSYDPDLLNGWGKRFYNWEFTTSVQHELAPRLSLNVQYARRLYGNFRVTDDRAVTPADYTQFTITTPSDTRLPNGGGYPLTGFDITAAGNARAQDYFVTLAKNYGTADRALRCDQRLRASAAQQRPDVPGGRRTGPSPDQRLRSRGRSARDVADNGGQPDAQLRGGIATARALRAEQRLAHGRHWLGHLHDSEDRRAGQRHISEPAGHPDGR